jgi:hypothetical protein
MEGWRRRSKGKILGRDRRAMQTDWGKGWGAEMVGHPAGLVGGGSRRVGWGDGVRPASGRSPEWPPATGLHREARVGDAEAVLSWKRETMGNERGELINPGQKRH